MDAYFFNSFSKRKNSTKQPTLSAGTKKEVVLKENCSLHNPVLLLTSPSFSWTYCVLDKSTGTNQFTGYYFVSDMVQISNTMWEVYLECDPMAEAKSDIGLSTFHIAFSSTFTNKMIPDPRIMVKASNTTHNSIGTGVLDITGCYVLTVLNGFSPALGMGTTYIMKQSCVQKLAQWFVAEYQNFFSQFFNGSPMEGIFSLIWVPFAFPTDAGSGQNPSDIYIGNRSMVTDGYTIPADSCRMLTADYYKDILGSVDCHLRYPIDDFRSVEPYTTGSLFLPGIGNVDISMSDFTESTKIYVQIHKEYTTGDMLYTVYAKSGIPTDQMILASYTCNVAAQCPLGQITTNANGVVSGLTTMAGGAAASIVSLAAGNAMGAVGGAGAAIGGIANMLLSAGKRIPSVSGSITGRGWSRIPGIYGVGCIEHTEVSSDTEDPDDVLYIAERGRPVGSMQQISSLSGYVQCEGASLETANIWAEDRDKVNDYLNNGFYYE